MKTAPMAAAPMAAVGSFAHGVCLRFCYYARCVSGCAKGCLLRCLSYTEAVGWRVGL